MFFVERVNAERRWRRADDGFDIILNERPLLFLRRRLRGNGGRHQHRHNDHKTSHHYLPENVGYLLEIRPAPSLTVMIRLASIFFNVSTDPPGQRISIKSILLLAPSPK